MSVVSAVAFFSAILSAAWAGFCLLVKRAVRQVAPLLEQAEMQETAFAKRTPGEARSLPTLSVVVTARDEAASIETTVRRLLAQVYPALEIIVLDDRSSDGTGEILDRLRSDSGDPRLSVIHNRALPRGWLGKCHACHLGAGRATGLWLLFMDGDVELATDDFLARVVGLAQARACDHIALLPDLRPVSPLQQAVLSVFAQIYLLAARAFEMDRDLRRGGAGIGAFNLVRRSAYDRIGGHTLLKMDPGDDYKLGRLLKESGARQRLFDAAGVVHCPWHRGALNVARGLEKNMFAGFGYSLTELVLFSLSALVFVFGPPALGLWAVLSSALAVRPAPIAAAWLPLLLEALCIGSGFVLQAKRQGGNPILLSLLYPAAVLILLGAAWNSAVRTITRGGIRWRDTFYPLAELRSGRVRAGAGRRLRVL